MIKQVTYLSLLPDEKGIVREVEVTKEVEVKELSRTDPKQHKLIAKSYGLIKGVKEEGEEGDFTLNGDVLISLIKDVIDILFIENKDVTKQDKEEMKKDISCIMEIQSWFLPMFLPFFLKLLKR